MYCAEFSINERIRGENERRRYIYADIFIMAMIALVYALNAVVIKPNVGGAVGYFAVCYLNDIMAPCFALSYVNIVAGAAGLRIRGFAVIEALSVTMGLFWETASQLIKPEAVADPLDIAACALGGVIYWALCRRLDDEF